MLICGISTLIFPSLKRGFPHVWTSLLVEWAQQPAAGRVEQSE